MAVHRWSGHKVRSVLVAKRCFIFLYLTVPMIYILWSLYNMKFHRQANPSISSKAPQVSTARHNLCAFRPISPEEALEENNILKSIAWPKTASITSSYTLNHTSDPSCSKFYILSKMEGGQWHVGNQLEVSIIMRDYFCHPKTSGGDVLLVSLKNQDLKAGVSGEVVDHLNGSYTAVFPLVWEGKAEVEVTLVHPGEAVPILQRLTSEQPDRVYFKSVYRSGKVVQTSKCNVCLRSSSQAVCDYTDVQTGEPWFCLKPKNLECDARIDHSWGGYYQNLQPKEDKLLQGKNNMKVPISASGSSSISVYPKVKDEQMAKSSTIKSGATGFYYEGVWKSLSNIQSHQFNTTSVVACLRGKMVHLYGDSTMRQWFEYFKNLLPDLKEFDLHSSKQVGPFMALDYPNNILVTYRCHGPPIRYGNVQISQLKYIANELDSIKGGLNTVVVFGVWSHFSTFPVEVYIRRLMIIRSSVLRLLARAPDTTVVIRTANPKALNSLYEALTNSDWYSLQRDKALRAVFKGVNVHLVDAWEMVLAHHLPHNLHPDTAIIKNMINVLLSYICPK